MSEWGRNFSAAHGGPGAGQPRFPGAWPAAANDPDVKDRHVDDHDDGQHMAGIAMRDNENGDDDGPHAASGAMYRSLEAKTRELQSKRGALADYQGDTQGEGSDGEKKGASTLAGMLAEIEELEKAVARLTLEADEQYARELVALED